MFTVEDRAFIRTILSNPAELSAWLVYADWLDEHDDPRAEFLRLEVRRGQHLNTDSEWGMVESRLRELRESLEPDWVSIFDRPKIENCEDDFETHCPKQWESLEATADNAVRRCGRCKKFVYYCRTLPEAQNHARQGHRVAIQLGVLRYPDDLSPEETVGTDEEIIARLSEERAMLERRRPWWKFW